MYSKDKNTKLKELLKDAKELLEKYKFYIREYENAIRTRKWNKK